MKANITILLFFNLIGGSVARAESQVFTTVSHSGKEVFAGVKILKEGMEPETYLMEISTDTFSSKKIPLSGEVIHREVIALFPAEKDQLIVVTQRTVEQGDKPMVHLYNPSAKTWKKVADVGCVSFAKIKVEASALTVNCLETNAKGEEVEKAVKVGLSGVRLVESGNVTLPQEKVEKANLRAELTGESLEWKGLKVGANKKEKVFTP